MDSKQEDCEARNDDKTMPLFFFFSCKTSGTNFMRHKVMDIAVHCWPYKEDAPMFYSRIHHNCKKESTQQSMAPRFGKSGINSTAETVISNLLKWINDTTETANSELALNLYPVLFAQGGETFQFLFFFRMLESYDIDPRTTLETHNIHYADPLPILKQYKDAKHPLLLQSRSFGLGSLLNDWFPAQFTNQDLLDSRSRGSLVVKLYTQCSLHWLLYRTPIYNTNEWIEFYEGEKYYREDKVDLEENLPASVVGLQRKLTVKHLLKHGYNWSRLIDLFTSCGSLHHFQQELRDMDIKTGAARRITYRLDEMNLEQDGSREYKVRIKSNMPHAKYYHLTDARGRHFMLRVANVLPPCICSLIDPPDNQWKVPANLLQINLSDIWDSKTDWESHKAMMDNSQDVGRLHGVEVEGQYGDSGEIQNALNATNYDADQPITPLEDTDSDADWEITSEPEYQCLDENEELLDSFTMVQTYRPTTTLQKGLPGVNPFQDTSKEWLFEEVTEIKEECQKELPVSASDSQSNTEDITLLTNQMASSTLSRFKSSNQKDSSSARAFCSTSSHSSSSSKMHHSALSNQMFSSQSHHSQSTNYSSSSGSKRCRSKQFALSNHSPTESRYCTSANQNGPKQSHHRPSANPGLAAGCAPSTESCHFTSANQNGPKRSHQRPSTNPGLAAGFALSTESRHFTLANQNGPKRSHHRPSTNPGLAAGFAPSTESQQFTSANQNGPKQPYHHPKTNHDLIGWSLQSTATPSNQMVSTLSHDFQSANQTAHVGADHSKATGTTSFAENLKGQKNYQGKGEASMKRRRQKKSKRDSQN
ncbi:uncharacterized protein LOC117302330 isoform X2 [Asterias rubens]|uniref:uncharacterized protein LOC117302330 isoform X2 n=1 Tax=Asterias rubens TaxID=7604 RepID=UPI0014557297|nr:uncharacterized protein LOC117302330 isoform X2 [Asterias rubens]